MVEDQIGSKEGNGPVGALRLDGSSRLSQVVAQSHCMVAYFLNGTPRRAQVWYGWLWALIRTVLASQYLCFHFSGLGKSTAINIIFLLFAWLRYAIKKIKIDSRSPNSYARIMREVRQV